MVKVVSFVGRSIFKKVKKYRTILIITLIIAFICFFVTKTNKTPRRQVKTFKSCVYGDFSNKTLTEILEFYREINNKDVVDEDVRVIKTSDDVLFNFTTYCEARKTGKSHRHKFYEPKLLINNRHACKVNDKNGLLYLTFIVNSYRGNYAHRQAMRETWMSKKFVDLNDLIHPQSKHKYSILTNKLLYLKHLFIVGSEVNQSNERIIEENNKYNDILLIDTQDTYKNVIYKNMAVINWINENCRNSMLYMKMDDDVVIKLIPFLSHLYFKFGLDYPLERGFVYGDIKNNTAPLRETNFKWHVTKYTWPFSKYPNYCQGFAFLANFKAIKLIYEQSKLIPRFWIDDVYLFGILLYDFYGKQIDLFDFRNNLKFRFYRMLDLNNSLVDYELSIQNKSLKLIYSQPLDFFIDSYFVVLHAQKSVKAKSLANLFAHFNKFNKTRVENDSKHLKEFLFKNKSTALDCLFKTYSKVSDKYTNCKYMSHSKLIDKVEFSKKSSLDMECVLETSIRVKTCISFENENLSFFNIYFYHFFANFWQKTQSAL
jgi:hypothetical protein